MLGVYRNYLDIDVLDTNNVKTLVIADSSSYVGNPDSPLLEVFLPGYSKYFLVPFIAKQVNTYNSNTLGMQDIMQQNCIGVLPDGVWTFKYKICPYEFVSIVKNHLRTAVINDKIATIYNNIDLRTCESRVSDLIKNQLGEIHILLEGAKAIVNLDERKASDYYKLADKMVNELLHKHCSHCKV